MKQITEDYVSYEIAKLLQEKGFDEPCLYWYLNTIDEPKTMCSIPFGSGKSLSEITISNSQFQNTCAYRDRDFAAPTHQMVLKWLREVHHYYIQIMLDSWACGDHLGYYVVIQKTDSDFEMMLQDAVDEVFYQTYEEACEAALKYTLENLI